MVAFASDLIALYFAGLHDVHREELRFGHNNVVLIETASFHAVSTNLAKTLIYNPLPYSNNMVSNLHYNIPLLHTPDPRTNGT